MAALITGGARSGKSSFAERYAAKLAERGIYIATAAIGDDEMRERITRHREQREEGGFRWETVEETLKLAEQLDTLNQEADEAVRSGSKPPVVLVDCLTLWLTNTLLAYEHEPAGRLEQEVDRLVEAVAAYRHPLLLVTNEVGSGIVPAYPLGRTFRDAAGRMNRKMAEVCDRTFLVVSGIPVDLSRIAVSLDDL
ncbi:adenosylcobinamide kinase /adenosylcobinamide-phosphate guanylyltransferase [Paenibacillus cellulosilyticus]|uniref:Adenosylcobinamide kinase n=1 Tax=Paenibacillus cellulosilyticus TaxID=375489 RepID=A0A2V2YZ04_9BACL|nr:bifunctional adenosylcobinamide kinase/adenosylcobinamide-phosphate guanylyltransferase [Paenibacillus cellulosilyticus]PWW06501.1 adenosylcobinamide kinase /adenosylcobinamide-phosphate guanylyltransferase [Paenibacillus cellulosilyticus]QKS46160.1 bifunctional adenosylcobinamide kinase/adenosylcobinamide-phosphate guanylyltransferase [Paenibacillus cellulosilyticus]